MVSAAIFTLLLAPAAGGACPPVQGAFSPLAQVASKLNHDWDFSRHSCILKGEIIVTGASISAGIGMHPLDILRGANPNLDPHISKITAPGMPSSANIERVLASSLASPGTIFAVDLFFWDGNGGASHCENSVRDVQRLLKHINEYKINLVLGNIPNSLNLDCQKKINAAMEPCRKLPTCHLIDIDKKLTQFEKTGSVPYLGGSTIPPSALRTDGLHLSRAGATVFAEEIMKDFDTKPPLCTEAPPP